MFWILKGLLCLVVGELSCLRFPQTAVGSLKGFLLVCWGDMLDICFIFSTLINGNFVLLSTCLLGPSYANPGLLM